MNIKIPKAPFIGAFLIFGTMIVYRLSGECLFIATYIYRNFKLKIKTMGNLLYLIAVILVIIWAISFFGGYYTGGIIHVLLVIAIIAVILRVIRSAA